MRSKHGLVLAIFLGLLLLATLVVIELLEIKSDAPTILIILAGAVIGVWAVTNADKLVISLTGSLSNREDRASEPCNNTKAVSESHSD